MTKIHDFFERYIDKHGDVIQRFAAKALDRPRFEGRGIACGGFGCVLFVAGQPWVVKLTTSRKEYLLQCWLSRQQAKSERQFRPLRRGFAIVAAVSKLSGDVFRPGMYAKDGIYDGIYAVLKERVRPLEASDECMKTSVSLSLYTSPHSEERRLLTPADRRVVRSCYPAITSAIDAARRLGVNVWDVRPANMGMRIANVIPGSRLSTGHPVIVDPEPENDARTGIALRAEPCR